MKKIFRIFAVIGIASMTAFVACQKPETDNGKKDDEEGKTPSGPTYAEIPFSKVTVTADGETVEGTVQEEKYIYFHFSAAESFNDATLAVTVNEGYELTYPTTLEHVDLQAEPVLNFKDPKNATVKFWLKFSSDAFPIVDESKIHLEGLEAGQLLAIDNATKTFTVTYDKEKLNYNAVTLVFEDGALQSGATVKTNLTYDFTNGLEQPLVIDLGGDRNYTVKLDVSAYVKMGPSDFGFTDETYKYVDNVDDFPYLKVWRADYIAGVPCYTLDNAWVQANPYEWDYSWAYEDGAGYNGYHYDWTDAFAFLGNWAEDRPTEKCVGAITIVTINQEAVSAQMVTNENYSMKLGDAEGFITIPGYSDNLSNWHYMLYANGKVRANPDGAIYRSSIGINPQGKIEFATAVASDGGTSVKKIGFQTDHASEVADVAASATEWNVESAAWALPWILRDGVAMGWEDLLNNDSARWSESFGQGWNSVYPGHVVIGTTYDNKIGIICNPGGADMWDGADTNDNEVLASTWGWFKGYTTNQMAWLAQKMGWRDVIVLSGQNGEGNGNASTVRINGKSVFHQEDHPYNSPEPYANEGADVNCAYALVFNKR